MGTAKAFLSRKGVKTNPFLWSFGTHPLRAETEDMAGSFSLVESVSRHHTSSEAQLDNDLSKMAHVESWSAPEPG